MEVVSVLDVTLMNNTVMIFPNVPPTEPLPHTFSQQQPQHGLNGQIGPSAQQSVVKDLSQENGSVMVLGVRAVTKTGKSVKMEGAMNM